MSDLDLIFFIAVAMACELFNFWRLRRRVARLEATIREERRKIDRLLEIMEAGE